MRRERTGEEMVAVKKTSQIEKHHENRKMTCHEGDSRSAFSGAGGVKDWRSYWQLKNTIT